MFYSAKDLSAYFQEKGVPGWAFHQRTKIPSADIKSTRKFLRAFHEDIRMRNDNAWHNKSGVEIYKFLRPWDVVEKLASFEPPVGDYGIGVEVECGFNAIEYSREARAFVSRWHNVAVDTEGSYYGTETTFKPILLSKLSSKSQCMRYVAKLGEMQQECKLNIGEYDGTHVNVSIGGVNDNFIDEGEVEDVMGYLTSAQNLKYFGRTSPYGYAFGRWTANSKPFVEWKLFRTTTDPEVLRRYIHTAVALTELFRSTYTGVPSYEGDTYDVSRDMLIETLEKTYNKYA